MLTFFPQFKERIDVRFLGRTDDRTVPDPRVKLWQEHGNRTIVARGPTDSTEQADGVITDMVGLRLTVRAADCQNFAIYAPEAHVAGVLHVGWRGLLAGAIGAHFRALEREFGIRAEETVVAAGPSLCLACAEFADPAHALRRDIDPKYVQGNNADLRSAATNQFVMAGVLPERINRHPDCTKCHPERYYTYRGGDRVNVESGISNVLVCTLL